MTTLFSHQKAAVCVLIAAFFLFGCGNNDSNADTGKFSAEISNEGATKGQDEKTVQNPTAYKRVEKTYNGQKIILFEMNDLPLTGESLDSVKEKANNDDPAAQYELGHRLCKGDGIIRNLQNGIQWIQKAALQNYPEAQFELGMLYSAGARPLLNQDPDNMGDYSPQHRLGEYIANNKNSIFRKMQTFSFCSQKPSFDNLYRVYIYIGRFCLYFARLDHTSRS